MSKNFYPYGVPAGSAPLIISKGTEELTFARQGNFKIIINGYERAERLIHSVCITNLYPTCFNMWETDDGYSGIMLQDLRDRAWKAKKGDSIGFPGGEVHLCKDDQEQSPFFVMPFEITELDFSTFIDWRTPTDYLMYREMDYVPASDGPQPISWNVVITGGMKGIGRRSP